MITNDAGPDAFAGTPEGVTIRGKPLLSVVVPVHPEARHLDAALAAVAASDLPRGAMELIVVLDGDSEDQPILAAQFADVVVRLGGDPHGPAYARNRGAEVARADVLVFVDSDVCVHADALPRIAAAFETDAALAALSGTYDTGPAHGSFAMRFRNHLDYYASRHPEPGAFAAGCGAVRRGPFLECGMFDEWRFAGPEAEGRELGMRLGELGYVARVDRSIRATHLKRWTVRGLLLTDLANRSVPWLRVVIQQRGVGGALRAGIGRSEGWNVLLAWLAVVLLPGLRTMPAVFGPAVAAAILSMLVIDGGLYVYLARRCGIFFALRAIPLQGARYVSAGAAFIVAAALDILIGEPAPDPAVAAWSECGVRTWPPVPAKRAELVTARALRG